MRPRAKDLKSQCPPEKTKTGIVVFKVVNDDLPEILVYRGERGDYIVADDFCTCPSFIKNLDVHQLKPCKHICAEKRVTEATTLVLDDSDFDMLILSLLLFERSVTLNLLLSERDGVEDGKEEKEEEDHR